MPARTTLIAKLTARRSAPLVAVGLMLLAALCYAITAVIARAMAEELNPAMIALLRNGFGLLAALPLVLRGAGAGAGLFRTARPGLHALRSGLVLVSMLAWFWALPQVVLADAVALNFTGPLFVTVGAVLLLGERMGPTRWAATLAGFAGALVIVRPGFAEVGLPLVAVVLSAAAWGGSALCNKLLTRTDTVRQIVVLNLMILVPASLGLALLDWRWPSALMLGFGALHGLLGTAANVLVARALGLADASYVIPFDFTRLPFAAAIAYAAFGELPDAWTVVGAAVIFAATAYVAGVGRRGAQ